MCYCSGEMFSYIAQLQRSHFFMHYWKDTMCVISYPVDMQLSCYYVFMKFLWILYPLGYYTFIFVIFLIIRLQMRNDHLPVANSVLLNTTNCSPKSVWEALPNTHRENPHCYKSFHFVNLRIFQKY